MLRDLQVGSLRNFAHLEILFRQAVKAGWLVGSEANFLNWVGAAVRATTVAARDPVRVFVSLVKRGRWDFITQDQEEQARAVIRRFRETPAVLALKIQTMLKTVEPKISSDIHERLLARQIIERSFPEIQQRSQLQAC